MKSNSEQRMAQRQQWLVMRQQLVHEASEASLKAGYSRREKKADRLVAYSENMDYDTQQEAGL